MLSRMPNIYITERDRKLCVRVFYWKWNFVLSILTIPSRRLCATHNRSSWNREYDWRRLCPQFCILHFIVSQFHAFVYLSISHRSLPPPVSVSVSLFLAPAHTLCVCVCMEHFCCPAAIRQYNTQFTQFFPTPFTAQRFTHSLCLLYLHMEYSMMPVRTYIRTDVIVNKQPTNGPTVKQCDNNEFIHLTHKLYDHVLAQATVPISMFWFTRQTIYPHTLLNTWAKIERFANIKTHCIACIHTAA